MFMHNKQDPRVLFSDIRKEEYTLCDGRLLEITPDIIADFKNLPFPDETFYQVLFDPPHLVRVGKNSWMFKKYGSLDKHSWHSDLAAGFREAFRVLRPHGSLIFKWNETQIWASQILELTEYKPTIVQRVGKNDKTHWMVFYKGADNDNN
ncbi:TPA: SAM-dependent methyltransferase [Morganella morganii]